MKTLFTSLTVIFTSLILRAQTPIAGFIKANDGPVEGATIVIRGTNQFTTTQADGRFELTTSEKLPFVIRVSYVGFKPQDFQIIEFQTKPLEITLIDDNELEEVVVTARRRSESVQAVPIPISVVNGDLVEDAGAFNVNRIKELVPSVQLYSSNPRNTTLNIRGLGSTFGLTNDGIDPGVGFYVDGVYYARPAATALDFVDLEQIEVLRGPQGTLFGKNTTAGAFNVTSRAASFTPGATLEVSYGNYGFIQAKSSVTGPLSKKLATRISFSGTQRDGLLYHVATQKPVNDLNNLGYRAQLLYTPTESIKITLIADATRQRPDGYAQVFAGVVTTQRAPYRQFEQIITDLNYQVPNRKPFDRKIDHNTTWRSGNDLGGVSLNADMKLGKGTLTSTSAWRYWNWDPSNDRDFTALSVLTLSQANSKHQQWTQEVRYAGDLSEKLSVVTGIFLIDQKLNTDPYHIEESGAAQWRFSQNSTSSLWETPGLLDGYGIRTKSKLTSFGAAWFGQLEWTISKKLHLLPGLRFNYDEKQVNFERKTYGGLQTDDPALLALKRSVYSDQAFAANAEESNWSGQLTMAYHPTQRVHSFLTYSTSYKPVGVNLGGLPTANGEILTDLARIKPEYVNHFEVGVKTNPSSRSTLNFVFHHTEIDDYQTQVQTAEVGVNRGYLANAEKVQVYGAELDGNIRVGKYLSLYGAVAYTVGEYTSFTNAPVPLEETGAANAFKDISGGTLPGISKWAGSIGGEFLSNPLRILDQESKIFLAFDTYYRSSFSSSASPSAYLNITGYALVNGRFGIRSINGLSAFVWGRNLLDKNYFEQLLPASGNAGHYAGVLGDPATYGITLRYSY
jgi:iron complex outermembrane recepter protein